MFDGLRLGLGHALLELGIVVKVYKEQHCTKTHTIQTKHERKQNMQHATCNMQHATQHEQRTVTKEQRTTNKL